MPKPTTRYTKAALLVGVIATLTCGCGLKGPLYHPGDNPQQSGQPNSSPVPRKKSPFSRIPAPQAQKHPKQDSGNSTPSDPPPAVDPTPPATTPPSDPPPTP